MPEVIDLDAIVEPDKTVRFGGKEYRVPGDLPMELFLRLNLIQGRVDDKGDADLSSQIQELADAVGDLLGTYSDTSEAKAAIKADAVAVIRQRGVRYIFGLTRLIYPPLETEEAGEAEGSTEAPAQPVEDSNGTTSSSTLPSPTSPTAPEAPAAS